MPADVAPSPSAAAPRRRPPQLRRAAAAARDVFAEQGTSGSLEEVARRAGVGIGTLYRNFPTRQDLFETVYVEEIEQLCQTADDVADLPPWDALVAWLQRFVGYIATKRAILEELNRDSPC